MTSCDYSPVVINKMKERCSEKMSMKCMVASEVSLVGDVEDIHHMSYPDESFDVVIDKGTLDALNCGNFEVVEKLVMSMEYPEQRIMELS